MKTKYTVSFTKTFRHEFEKLSKVDQKRVGKTLVVLEENPSYPSLRTKKMRDGSGRYESSVNMDIRILWMFDDDNASIIVALDVGHHDVLRR
jgi:mRNA-degrading endonuclease RelE of RelBE toxin-antitoxin system